MPSECYLQRVKCGVNVELKSVLYTVSVWRNWRNTIKTLTLAVILLSPHKILFPFIFTILLCHIYTVHVESCLSDALGSDDLITSTNQISFVLEQTTSCAAS